MRHQWVLSLAALCGPGSAVPSAAARGRSAPEPPARPTRPLSLRASADAGSRRVASAARSPHAFGENPWVRPPPPFGAVEQSPHPVAPEDSLAPGIDSQGPGSDPVKFYPEGEDVPWPFPQPYPGVVWAPRPRVREPPRGNRAACVASVDGWADADGNSCADLALAGWCTAEGREGPGWMGPGRLEDLLGQGGTPATSACCECGGGFTTVLTVEPQLPLADRRLYAPEDLAGRGRPRAPEDAVALRLPGDVLPRQDPPVAREDRVPAAYARYFQGEYVQSTRPDLMGLTARYYLAPPVAADGGASSPSPSGLVELSHTCPQPFATTIPRAIDYRTEGMAGLRRDLQGPLGHDGLTDYFWVRFSGTVQILIAGNYTFDLSLGFDSESDLRVGEQSLLTRGQCRSSRTSTSCASKGCAWDPVSYDCLPVGIPAAPGNPAVPEPLLAPAALKPGGSAPAAALAHAPAAAPAPTPGTGLAPAPAPQQQHQQQQPGQQQPPQQQHQHLQQHAPAPAPAPQQQPQHQQHQPQPAAALAELAVAAPAPAAQPAARGDTALLTAGGHCVDLVVLVPSWGKTMSLYYRGPDTSGKRTVIPGQVLYCDPVVAACKGPELQACGASTSGCGPRAAAPAPAPVAAAPVAPAPAAAAPVDPSARVAPYPPDVLEEVERSQFPGAAKLHLR